MNALRPRVVKRTKEIGEQIQPKLVLPLETVEENPQLQHYSKIAEVALRDTLEEEKKKSAA